MQDMVGNEEVSFGSFSVDDLGRVSVSDGTEGGFAFQWRGRPIALTVQGMDPSGKGPFPGRNRAATSPCRIRMSARVGRVPSTAVAAAKRPDAFRLTSALSGLLPQGWCVRLLPDHMLQFQSEEQVPLPALIGELLVSATRFTLTLAPFLDLLEEHGVEMNA
ncbi:MAG: hypothetical protein ACRYGI_12015 [Janthinobacterium lividum]